MIYYPPSLGVQRAWPGLREGKIGRYLKQKLSRVFYGWWIVALGSAILAVGSGILYHSFTAFFLPLKRDLGVSSAAISLLFAAARLEGGVEGPIVGSLIDRFGPRWVIIGGATLAGVGLLVVSLAHSFLAVFLIYLFVISVGYNAGFFHPISTAVNSWFIRYRATGFALISAAGSIGGAVMVPVLSYLILNHGWRFAAVVSGLAILAVTFPAALPIHRSPEERGLHPDGQLPPPAATRALAPNCPEAPEVEFTVKQALRTSSYWMLMLSITLRIAVTLALGVHFIPILVWRGMDEVGAAYLVSLFAFSSIVSALFLGWLGDRGNKPLLSALGILTTVAGMLGLLLSQTTIALYLFPIGLAITMGTPPLNWSLIGDFFGRRSYGTLRGIMAAGYGTAGFFSPIYAGWVFDRTESYALVLVTFSAVLVAAALLFTTLRRPLAPSRS